jgi:hypothetical protein
MTALIRETCSLSLEGTTIAHTDRPLHVSILESNLKIERAAEAAVGAIPYVPIVGFARELRRGGLGDIARPTKIWCGFGLRSEPGTRDKWFLWTPKHPIYESIEW